MVLMCLPVQAGSKTVKKAMPFSSPVNLVKELKHTTKNTVWNMPVAE